MTLQLFDSTNYISIEELKKYKKVAKLRNIRTLLQKFTVPNTEYVYITSIEGKKYHSERMNRKAIIYFKKKYFEDILEPQCRDPKIIPPGTTNISLLKTMITPIQSSDKTTQNSVISSKQYPKIILNKDEEFILDGIKYDVDLRGERHFEKIFISVLSVGKMFGIQNLSKEVIRNSSNEKGKDFIMIRFVSLKSKLPIRRCYFSYDGFVKYTYSSKSPKAEILRKAFNKILFTHQFGTPVQKKKLASKLLGVSVDEVKKVLKASPSALSCVYFIILGTAKDLRTIMNVDIKYPDTYLVCKFGRTKDLEKRISTHNTTFSKYGCTISLKYYARIDSSACSKAEAVIKKYIQDSNIGFSFEKYSELAIIPHTLLNTSVKEQFTIIERLFCIENKELANSITLLENKLEIQKLKQENEIQKKDNEIEKLQMQMKIQFLEYEMKLQKLQK